MSRNAQPNEKTRQSGMSAKWNLFFLVNTAFFIALHIAALLKEVNGYLLITTVIALIAMIYFIKDRIKIKAEAS